MSHSQTAWETVYKKVPWKGCPYYSLTSFRDLLENQVRSFSSSLWPSSFFSPPTSRGREKQSKGQAEMLRRLKDEGKDREMEGDIIEIWTPGYFRRTWMVEGPSFLVGKSIAEIDNGLKKKPMQLSRRACWHQIQGWSLKRMVSEKGWKINSWRTRTTSSFKLFDSE